MRRSLIAVALAAAAAVTLLSQAPARIPVMMLDGESGGAYHDWQRVTAVLTKALDEAGRFETSVVTAAPTTGMPRAFVFVNVSV